MSPDNQPNRFIYFFGDGYAEGGNELRHLVGGKGASLAEMTRAGLNVPPGFTISAECCERYCKEGKQWPPGLEGEVRANLVRLEQLTGRSFGKGANPLLVAVRSGAAQSMPGMMDTVLNVGLSPEEPWRQLCGAINAVFDSWNSDRAVAYRQHHQIDGLLGTAVNVQMMCPAEVAGVMFTANPVDPAAEQIIIESALGLGEALVLGKVTPDRFGLSRHNLEIVERSIAVSENGSSLSDGQLAELARLGLRVEAYFQHPCDIEWAFAGGQFYLLQSRPIKLVGWAESSRPTTVGGVQEISVGLEDSAHPTPPAHPTPERERIRQEEIAELAAKAEPGGTVWSRFNLAEILPAPTPMTWAIVRRFMSGKGGFGLMYRDLGFDPDPALDEEGIYDLVCGRPYCNLSREPRMQYRRLPFEHNFAALKADPQKALYPQPVLNPVRGGWRFWLCLPVITWGLMRSAVRLRRLSRTFAADFREHILPSFLEETAREAEQDLSQLDMAALLPRLECWIWRTLCDFARHSLKPTVFAAVALGNLERALCSRLGPERTKLALGELMMGILPDPEADLPTAIRGLISGTLDRGQFLQRFGHRGQQEMELSQPRWSEDAASLDRMSADTIISARIGEVSPEGTWNRLADEAKLPAARRTTLLTEWQDLRAFLSLRETAKHHLMKGYALIRRILVEIDRRYGLDGGVFFLKPVELLELHRREHIAQLIAERRRRREIVLSLEVPQVLLSDDLEAIGRETTASAAESLHGVPISAGVAEGPALVLLEPSTAALPAEPYILVCPSTDPAWVPLFVQAKGLVIETGGVLSHGAIVAREFGLPAVAGIPDVHRRIRTGQRLRVDGSLGSVSVLG